MCQAKFIGYIIKNMEQEVGNKRIAKNTIFLYVRMLLTMIVTLYTSRVILQVIGVTDYGVYQSVAGIVGFLAFLNNALSTGTSRFLTYALGEQNESKLAKTFSTTLAVHILISLVIVVIAETAGLWLVYNKLSIPPERFFAAVVAFHLSIVSAVFTLITVPYNAVIIAREKMEFFAYISIVEVVVKLLVVFALNIGNIDKLILYSVLLLLVQVALFLGYYIYTRKYFHEVKSGLYIDKTIFKEVVGFSSWSLFAGGATALNNQGIIILLNIFFSSPIVVARTISLQVNSAATQFVNNFRTAVNPQIVKRLASGDRQGSQNLLLDSTRYSYFLMLVICLPLLLASEQVLRIWLGVVPDYSVIFLRLVLIQSLFQVFDTSFYTALYAEGKMKENALISPSLGFLMFPLVYLLLKMGCGPESVSWVFLFYYAFLGLVVKPLLIIRIAKYTWVSILSVLLDCLKVTLVSIPVPVILLCFSEDSLFNTIGIILGSVISVLISVLFIGIDKDLRIKISHLIYSKIKSFL